MNASLKRIAIIAIAIFVCACTYYPAYYASYTVPRYYYGGGYAYYERGTPGYYGYYPRVYGFSDDRHEDHDERQRDDERSRYRRDNDRGRFSSGNGREYDRRGSDDGRRRYDNQVQLAREYRNAPYERSGAGNRRNSRGR
ncbi:MAG: hypothetical protein ACU837_05070 [Gammaproteobacteria bacterium]